MAIANRFMTRSSRGSGRRGGLGRLDGSATWRRGIEPAPMVRCGVTLRKAACRPDRPAARTGSGSRHPAPGPVGLDRHSVHDLDNSLTVWDDGADARFPFEEDDAPFGAARLPAREANATS